MADELIVGAKIRVERKLFFLDLKQNHQGAFLKITEDVNGRRDTVIIPSTGIREFMDTLNELVSHLPPDVLEPMEDDEQPSNIALDANGGPIRSGY
jgi:PurA ssDNA and RNA-binding protein